MNAYIIASVRSGIEQALPDIFPGCQIVSWQPVKKELKGKVKEAVQYLEERINSGSTDFIKFVDVAGSIGVQPSDFKKIRRHPSFVEAIASLGLIEYGLKVKMTGFFLLGNSIKVA